ncbi:pentapeptide repeat domain protein [Mycobacterium xenopi 3993]|nr:pentapeptide repeat domain protein [Mycobacterium xenopi 3993]EUA31258.1 pentapeptide repeat domain protein [Mycobacterium xenopi 3993]
MTYRDLLADVIAPEYTLPDGYDSWGLKSVHPDLRTRNGFRWPFPEMKRRESNWTITTARARHDRVTACVWRKPGRAWHPVVSLPARGIDI